MATKDQLAPTQDLEALKDSIGGLETRSAGFLERKIEVDRVLDEAHNLQSQLRDEHTGLESDRRRLFEERERLLRAQLESEGLAVCSGADGDIEPYNHHHHQYEDTVWGSADSLRKYGVFPKDEMTMVYSASTYEQRRKEGYFDSYTTISASDFRIYCPAHAPDPSEENYSRPSKFGEQYGPDEWTRVVNQDGELVREIDGEEIYEAPRQGRLAQAVYDHFGYPAIQSIPEQPRWR